MPVPELQTQHGPRFLAQREPQRAYKTSTPWCRQRGRWQHSLSEARTTVNVALTTRCRASLDTKTKEGCTRGRGRRRRRQWRVRLGAQRNDQTIKDRDVDKGYADTPIAGRHHQHQQEYESSTSCISLTGETVGFLDMGNCTNGSVMSTFERGVWALSTFPRQAVYEYGVFGWRFPHLSTFVAFHLFLFFCLSSGFRRGMRGGDITSPLLRRG